MINIVDELQNQIDKLQKQIDKLQKKIEELPKEIENEKYLEVKSPFEEGEHFFTIEINGTPVNYICEGHDWELKTWLQGNIFKTEEEVELERDRRILLTKFRQFRDKCNGDWKPEVFECKYFITYDSFKNVLESSWNDTWDNFHTFGDFKHERDCLRAIELFGDEIIRLWVEE
jgi:hypothetical protein